jgi:hypothetical protein
MDLPTLQNQQGSCHVRDDRRGKFPYVRWQQHLPIASDLHDTLHRILGKLWVRSACLWLCKRQYFAQKLGAHRSLDDGLMVSY